MNIRKNTDYNKMYEAIDRLMTQQLPQMELYCAIGRAVCRRTEKGAAVMAAEYLHEHYPDVPGFSPRNVRRMRDFYRTYENHPALLRRAMELGWSQNVVIMKADLTMELREWYMKAVKRYFYLVHGFPAEIVHDEVWNRPTLNTPNPIPDCQLIIGHTPVIELIEPEEAKYEYVAELESREDHLRICHAPGFLDIDCCCGYDIPIKAMACMRLEDMKEFYQQ